MSIDHSNFEAYLLDEAEGKLNPKERFELLQFLKENPTLQNGEYADYGGLKQDLPRLNLEEEINSDELKKIKWNLKREESTLLPFKEYLLIAQAEKQLTKEEKRQLSNLRASYPNLKQEEQLYFKSKLRPNLNLKFPKKHLLYKNKKVALLFGAGFWRAAASVLLILSLGLYFFREKTPHYAPQANSERLGSVIQKVKEAKPIAYNYLNSHEKRAAHKAASEVASADRQIVESERVINPSNKTYTAKSSRQKQVNPPATKMKEIKPMNMKSLVSKEKPIPPKAIPANAPVYVDKISNQQSLAEMDLKKQIDSLHRILAVKKAQLNQKQTKTKSKLGLLMAEAKETVLSSGAEVSQEIRLENHSESFRIKIGKIEFAKK